MDIASLVPYPSATQQPWDHNFANLALETIEYAVAAYARAPFLAETSTIEDVIIELAKWWPFLNHQVARRLQVATALIKTLKIDTNQQDVLEDLFDIIVHYTSADSRIAILDDGFKFLINSKSTKMLCCERAGWRKTAQGTNMTSVR